YYLAQRKYAKFRPLRFVATGAAFATVGLLVAPVLPTTRAWVRPEPPPAPRADLSELSRVEQLRALRDQRSYDQLTALLGELTKTDEVQSADAKNRDELAKEMKALCSHRDTGVRVAAMAAYSRWGGADAVEVCLNALRPDRS